MIYSINFSIFENIDNAKGDNPPSTEMVIVQSSSLKIYILFIKVTTFCEREMKYKQI